jgi:hypothetical protein
LTRRARLGLDVTADATDSKTTPDGTAATPAPRPSRSALEADAGNAEVQFDPHANVDPNHVEPVGTSLGEPAKEHWDTKQPERRDLGRPDATATADPESLTESAP